MQSQNVYRQHHFLVFAIGIIALFGCGDGDDDTKGMVGSWELVLIENNRHGIHSVFDYIDYLLEDGSGFEFTKITKNDFVFSADGSFAAILGCEFSNLNRDDSLYNRKVNATVMLKGLYSDYGLALLLVLRDAEIELYPEELWEEQESELEIYESYAPRSIHIPYSVSGDTLHLGGTVRHGGEGVFFRRR